MRGQIELHVLKSTNLDNLLLLLHFKNAATQKNRHSESEPTVSFSVFLSSSIGFIKWIFPMFASGWQCSFLIF